MSEPPIQPLLSYIGAWSPAREGLLSVKVVLALVPIPAGVEHLRCERRVERVSHSLAPAWTCSMWSIPHDRVWRAPFPSLGRDRPSIQSAVTSRQSQIRTNTGSEGSVVPFS